MFKTIKYYPHENLKIINPLTILGISEIFNTFFLPDGCYYDDIDVLNEIITHLTPFHDNIIKIIPNKYDLTFLDREIKENFANVYYIKINKALIDRDKLIKDSELSDYDKNLQLFYICLYMLIICCFDCIIKSIPNIKDKELTPNICKLALAKITD